jgi:uncharacterized protein DUF4325
MTQVFKMSGIFGPFLADGDLANKFRFEQVEKHLEAGEAVVFDFGGVENMTDSFFNACFGNILRQHGVSAFQSQVNFVNGSPLIQQFRDSMVSGLILRIHQAAQHLKTFLQRANGNPDFRLIGYTNAVINDLRALGASQELLQRLHDSIEKGDHNTAVFFLDQALAEVERASASSYAV